MHGGPDELMHCDCITGGAAALAALLNPSVCDGVFLHAEHCSMFDPLQIGGNSTDANKVIEYN